MTRTNVENKLIAALPSADAQRLIAECKPVELEFGEILAEEGDTLRYVYFPLNCFVSLVADIDGAERLEVGLVGNEGMLGASIVLGVNVASLQAVVQGAGSALRMTLAAFKRELGRSPALHGILNRYVCVQIDQLGRTAICTHYHRIETRLARWLLMTRDRAGSNAFRLTQEFIAFMLGVRRVGITDAAGALQKRGLISYKRGNITILNEAGLEDAACRCYEDLLTMYGRILGRGLALPSKQSPLRRKRARTKIS